MLSDMVRDTPQPRCLSKVCAPAKYRSPFVLTVISLHQYYAEGRSASCFLQALETVKPEFREGKAKAPGPAK